MTLNSLFLISDKGASEVDMDVVRPTRDRICSDQADCRALHATGDVSRR